MNFQKFKSISVICFALILYSCLPANVAFCAENNDVRVFEQTGEAIAKIAESASPAVVSVRIQKTVKTSSPFGNNGSDPIEKFFERFFPGKERPDNYFEFENPPKQVIQGLGSGFIVESDGYIITNNHVVSEAKNLLVKLADGTEHTAKVIGTDAPTDLAVIKIEASNLPVLQLGDSEALKIGQWVIAIGNPFGLTRTVTVGVVSAKGRAGLGIEDYEDFIQTDAAINIGNSGGPLLNTQGKVVGINTAIVSPSGGSLGIGFAIPSDMAKIVYKQLREKGTVTRGYLGISIQPLTPALTKYFNLGERKGILVSNVLKDSPAEKAGLKQGDVITRINDQVVEDVSRFRNYVAVQVPDSKAQITLIREGNEQKIDVTIGKMPVETRQNTMQPQPSEDTGLTVQNLSSDLAKQLGYESAGGVVITGVEPGSRADEAGLKPGMLIDQVNRKEVKDVNQFNEEMKKALEKGDVLLMVRVGDLSQYVVLKSK